MVSEAQTFDFYRAADTRYGYDQQPLEFHVRYCASNVVVQMMDDLSNFRPIDAAPQMTRIERKSIEDFGIFATPLARTEEIIVEPETVSELLERIKSLQAPELAAIRERNRRRERDPGAVAEPMQRQRFHAQIVSLAA
jgi:hypothetical protein